MVLAELLDKVKLPQSWSSRSKRHVWGQILSKEGPYHVDMGSINYFFGPSSKCKGVARLLDMAMGRAHGADYSSLCISSQRVLKDPRKLGISIWDVPTSLAPFTEISRTWVSSCEDEGTHYLLAMTFRLYLKTCCNEERVMNCST